MTVPLMAAENVREYTRVIKMQILTQADNQSRERMLQPMKTAF